MKEGGSKQRVKIELYPWMVLSLPPQSVNSLGSAEMKCKSTSRGTLNVHTIEAAASRTRSQTDSQNKGQVNHD